MTLFNWMGLLTTIALVLPIITLLVCRLAWYKSFPILLFYYCFVLSYNLAHLGYIKASRDFTFYFGTISNLLDTPLVLFFLTYFSKTAIFRRRLIIAIGAFMLFEILIVAVYGLTTRAATIIMGPGFILIVALSLLFFIHQVKIAVMYHKAIGKAIMATSILFAYVGYSFVYTVYYVLETPSTSDTYIVYFLITIASCVSMATGIFFERKRVRKLGELRTTRKELNDIYGASKNGSSKKNAPFGTVALNLDNDQWN
jgi:hypothetical protein